MTSSEIVSPFVKARASGQNGNCVEVALTADGGRAVRHSKNPEGGTLFYTAAEWQAFEEGVTGGEFSAAALST